MHREECHASRRRSPVHLRVYDISNGKAAVLSKIFLRQEIKGIWHTGIHVFGLEYFYGGGIDCMPASQVESTFNMDIVDTQLLGYTSRTRVEFEQYLITIYDKFTPETYDLVKWNCNHFSDACSRFLLNYGIPEHIINLPNTVCSSMLGSIALRVFQRVTQGHNPACFSPDDPKHPRYEFFPGLLRTNTKEESQIQLPCCSTVGFMSGSSSVASDSSSEECCDPGDQPTKETSEGNGRGGGNGFMGLKETSTKKNTDAPKNNNNKVKCHADCDNTGVLLNLSLSQYTGSFLLRENGVQDKGDSNHYPESSSLECSVNVAVTNSSSIQDTSSTHAIPSSQNVSNPRTPGSLHCVASQLHSSRRARVLPQSTPVEHKESSGSLATTTTLNHEERSPMKVPSKKMMRSVPKSSNGIQYGGPNNIGGSRFCTMSQDFGLQGTEFHGVHGLSVQPSSSSRVPEYFSSTASGGGPVNAKLTTLLTAQELSRKSSSRSFSKRSQSNIGRTLINTKVNNSSSALISPRDGGTTSAVSNFAPKGGAGGNHRKKRGEIQPYLKEHNVLSYSQISTTDEKTNVVFPVPRALRSSRHPEVRDRTNNNSKPGIEVKRTNASGFLRSELNEVKFKKSVGQDRLISKKENNATTLANGIKDRNVQKKAADACLGNSVGLNEDHFKNSPLATHEIVNSVSAPNDQNCILDKPKDSSPAYVPKYFHEDGEERTNINDYEEASSSFQRALVKGFLQPLSKKKERKVLAACPECGTAATNLMCPKCGLDFMVTPANLVTLAH